MGKTMKEALKALKKANSDKKIQNKKGIKGFIFSPEDTRDYTLASVLGAQEEELPEEYRTEGEAKILNQGAVSSCVAHAIATAMAYGEYKSGRTDTNNYSRGYIYGNRKTTDYQGEGMVLRQALKQLNHCGDCLYSTFPWNEKYSSVKERIEKNKETYATEAENYKIVNYFRCYSEEDIKRAIMAQGAVIVGIDVYSGFGEYIEVPDVSEKVEGGHAMCCVGWNKDGWILQNSWGSIWGDKGYCYLPYDYPESEWWGITVNTDVPMPKEKNALQKLFGIIGYGLRIAFYYTIKFFAGLFKKKKDAEEK